MSSICPEKLSKNGGNVNLTTKWAQEILKSIDWVKRRGTIAKREMNSLTFTRKRKNANSLFEHGIHNEMSLNFDQTPLAFAAPNIPIPLKTILYFKIKDGSFQENFQLLIITI